MSNFFVHELSDVQTEKIGINTRIWQFVVILKGATIGSNCNINCNTFIENEVILGDNVTIKSGVYLWDGINIGDNVFIGPNATFVNNSSPRSQQYPEKHVGVFIQKGASIGANATIMGGIKIGKYAMIGAGSVVTHSVPAYQVWYGNPAKHKGYVTIEGEVLTLELKCKLGREFTLSANGKPVKNL
jgi:UDP-2-acetamido-3-amino-2,3-dideoxy-glucuronate N-acetyltransferase